MQFYRLYITEFMTSKGLKIYGGKRHSPYSNYKLDPYTGSGTIIINAKAKYGSDCIKCTRWSKEFESAELLKEAEELLVDELKSYKHNCVNLVRGGYGGWSYLDPKDNPNLGSKRSEETKAKMSVSAKNKKWTKEGLAKRKASTARMWIDFPDRHPDFSGSKNPAAKSIKVDNEIFLTGRDCAKHFNISPSTVIYRIKSTSLNWKGWNYV